RLEDVLQQQRAAVGQRHHQGVRAPVTEEQRRAQPEPVIGADVLPAADVLAVAQQRLVQQRDTLGQARAAGGEDDQGGIVRRGLVPRLAAASGREELSPGRRGRGGLPAPGGGAPRGRR